MRLFFLVVILFFLPLSSSGESENPLEVNGDVIAQFIDNLIENGLEESCFTIVRLSELRGKSTYSREELEYVLWVSAQILNYHSFESGRIDLCDYILEIEESFLDAEDRMNLIHTMMLRMWERGHAHGHPRVIRLLNLSRQPFFSEKDLKFILDYHNLSWKHM